MWGLCRAPGPSTVAIRFVGYPWGELGPWVKVDRIQTLYCRRHTTIVLGKLMGGRDEHLIKYQQLFIVYLWGGACFLDCVTKGSFSVNIFVLT